MKNELTKWVLGILLIASFLGCSRLDLAVTWADDYIVSKVDDYFDLSSQQNKDLKTAVKTDVRKIRKEQFPQWAAKLRQMARDLRSNKFNEDAMDRYFQEVLTASKSLQPAFTETAVKFISQANAEQLEHFERAVRKKNIEDEQKIQNRKKARNETRKKYLRGIEMWIDSLSQEQEQLLDRHLNENPFPAHSLIKNRNHVLEKFTEAQKSPEILKNFVRKYYTDKTQYADAEYQQALKNYQTELKKFLVQLLNSLNEKQKTRLSENLQEKADLLDKLAAKD